MSCLDGFVPARGLAFIKHVETEETYPGSRIIVPDQARDKVAKQQMVVTAVGWFERCEDEDCERANCRLVQGGKGIGYHTHDITPGDWVLVRNRAWDATPDPHIFVVRVDAILARLVTY